MAKVKFITKANSPFSDGYDIDAEREVLSDLINSTSDPDDKHPNYFRYMEYLDREEQLKKEASRQHQRHHLSLIHI